MKSNNYMKIYGILGKILCGCAGAIVGFVAAGIGLAVVGVLVGVFVGHVLEKLIVNPNFKKS